jgi:tetratricopeptide (TPR) repeat protein
MNRCLACLLVVLFATQILAQDKPAEVSTFQKPARVTAATQMMGAAAELFQQKKYAEAETICARAQEVAPFFPLTSYNLACFQAVQGKKDDALANLEKAIDAGFANVPHMQKDEDLTSLRDDPKFKELIDKAKAVADNPPVTKVEPGKIENGIATVTLANSVYDPSLNQVRIFFAPLAVPEAPEKPDPKPVEVIKGHGEVGKKLNEWFAAGTAAGNTGDLYDNCDRDHSNITVSSRNSPASNTTRRSRTKPATGCN